MSGCTDTADLWADLWSLELAKIEAEELAERMDGEPEICLHGHYEERCPDCNEEWIY